MVSQNLQFSHQCSLWWLTLLDLSYGVSFPRLHFSHRWLFRSSFLYYDKCLGFSEALSIPTTVLGDLSPSLIYIVSFSFLLSHKVSLIVPQKFCPLPMVILKKIDLFTFHIKPFLCLTSPLLPLKSKCNIYCWYLFYPLRSLLYDRMALFFFLSSGKNPQYRYPTQQCYLLYILPFLQPSFVLRIIF